jgi:hypothetical protein
MSIHPMIEAEEGRETAFFFEGHAAVFKTRGRRDEPVSDPEGSAAPSGGKPRVRHDDVDAPRAPEPPRAKGRDDIVGDPVWDIHVPGVVVQDSGLDPVWGVQWPGISSECVVMSRAFQSLEEVRRAIPEITRHARSQPAKPHVVLAAPHYGRLDPAAGLALVEDLRQAGADATVIIQHRSKPALAPHE